ncbi:hypothetical protein [Microbacterium sp. A84]|uniref:hypothetical protein n=1 Tax=Microbacterium sp. A84 TaxID=3450715 RepID=UPI003F424958
MTEIIGLPSGTHLARAWWQFNSVHRPQSFRDGWAAEVAGGELLQRVTTNLGAAAYAADFIQPTDRPAIHGVGALIESNIDHIAVSGNRLILVDDKGVPPGHHSIRPARKPVVTTEPAQLRAQGIDGSYYDGWAPMSKAGTGQRITRGLHIGAWELLRSARSMRIDVEVDCVLLVMPEEPGTVRIRRPARDVIDRPFTDAIFAHPDGSKLVTPGLVLTNDAGLAETLAAHIDPTAAPDEWVLSWLRGLYADSERVRQAHIDRERAAGAHLRIPNPLTA